MARLDDIIISPNVIENAVAGYSPQELVGYNLFPEVQVTSAQGEYATFGDRHYANFDPSKFETPLRTEGQRMEFDIDTHSIELKYYSEKTSLDFREIEDARKILNLATTNTMKLKERVMLNTEYLQATKATTTGNYTSGNYSSGDDWGDSATDVLADIETAKYVILDNCGKMPNTMIIGSDSWKVIRYKDEVTDKIKYTQLGVTSAKLFGELVEIPNVFIGSAFYGTKAGVDTKLWSDHCVLAYIDPNAGDPMLPNYGYTFTHEKYPQVTLYNEGARQKVIDYMESLAVELVSVPSGYLFYNTIS